LKVAAPLRNYFAPVFMRDNALIIAASWIVLLLVLNGVLVHGDIASIMADSRQTVFLTWGACWIVPGAVYAHYWRQVSTPQAPAVPGMIGAEFRAALVMTVLVILLIDLPFLVRGAPLIGMLALTLSGIVLSGSTMPPITSARGMPSQAWLWMTRARLALLAGLVLIGYQNRWFVQVLEAPLAFTVSLALAAGTILVALLWYLPVVMRGVIEGREQRQDARISRGRRKIASLAAISDWRPRLWPDAPVPAQFALPSGPIGMAVAGVGQYGIVFTIDLAIYYYSGDSWRATLHESAQQAMALICGLTAAQMSQSLLNRSGFALTFVAGRYGGRLHYSRSVFRAFVLNGVVRGIFVVAIGLVVPLWLRMLTPTAALSDGASIIVIILGGSLFGALPLFWHEFGGIGFAAFCAMFGYMFCYGGVFAALAAHGALALAIPATIAMIAGICGLTIYLIAPRRLATMDWPIDGEQV